MAAAHTQWMRRAATVLVAGVLALTAVPAAAQAQTIRGMQWYLDFLHVQQAQAISDGSGVTVAVIDSGVDASHPDLAASVLPGHSFGDAEGKPATQDTNGHGTHMAGLIAAHGDDTHALGIAPGVRILPVRTGVGEGSTQDDDAAGIRWAVDHGADVINISSGNNDSTPALVSAVHYAEIHDVVVVGAAGNVDRGDDGIIAPGRLKGVLNVTGVNQSGAFWSGSTQGKYATLSAPAVKIVGPTYVKRGESSYSEGTGTSDATAIVSGVAALVRARYPELNASNVINRIIRTATDRGPKGWDEQYGFGIVNPVAALTTDVPTVDKDPLGGPVPDPLASSAAPGGGAATPGDGSTKPNASGSGFSAARLAVFGALALVVLVIVVVVLLVLSRRRAGSRPASRPAPARQAQPVPWPNADRNPIPPSRQE
ncbi:MAG TPA: S8 family serine peptidase [Actinocatenispora sp.]